VGSADSAEAGGQLALHGVARGLRRGGDQREDGPEHVLSVVMRGLDPRLHDDFRIIESLTKVRACCAASWIAGSSPAMTEAGQAYAAADLISAASGNSVTSPFSLSTSRNRSK